MRSKEAQVRLTANFENNLGSIEAFCADAGAPRAYEQLLDVLLRSLIPDLEQFPDMGTPFLTRKAGSVEARRLAEGLKAKIGEAEIREYLFDEYLVLYTRIGTTVYLLAIRHHRQLSFDLAGFWTRARSRHDI